jgi:hypothetical protein
MVAVVLPRVDFILKSAVSLNITPPATLHAEVRRRGDLCETASTSTSTVATSFSSKDQFVKELEREEALESRSPWFRFLCSHPAVCAAVLASIVSAGHIYSNAHCQGPGSQLVLLRSRIDVTSSHSAEG